MGVAYLIGQRHHDAETDIDDDYFEVNLGKTGLKVRVMRIDGVRSQYKVYQDAPLYPEGAVARPCPARAAAPGAADPEP